MPRSKLSRHYKRHAALWACKADEAAASDAPWALGNVRTYQRTMTNALRKRNTLILTYLAERELR